MVCHNNIILDEHLKLSISSFLYVGNVRQSQYGRRPDVQQTHALMHICNVDMSWFNFKAE